MRRGMIRLAAVGAIGATVLAAGAWGAPLLDAAGLLDEVGIAGISISLENYAAKAVEEREDGHAAGNVAAIASAGTGVRIGSDGSGETNDALGSAESSEESGDFTGTAMGPESSAGAAGAENEGSAADSAGLAGEEPGDAASSEDSKGSKESKDSKESLDSLGSGNSQDSSDEADAEEEEEEIKTNLVYDRLGIAKVDNYLNIRKKPGEDQKIIGKLPKNAGCNIYKINKDGWAKIVSGKVRGWVSADYLVTDEEAEEYARKVATKLATVNTETLKVRALPSTDSKVYTLVPIEEDLEVRKEYLDEEYFEKFMSRQDEDSLAVASMEDVDRDEMMAGLDDWICVNIDDEVAFVNKQYVDISFKLERAVFIDEVKEDEAAGVTSTRASMVDYAMQFLGNRYVYGGTSLTNGTDCSGFTMRIYEHFGYSIPRTSSAQSGYFSGINSSDAKPGDLFFYGSGGHVSHVAMYIGNGQVIHASNERTGIKISNAFYRTPIKVGRIINE